MYIIYLMKAGKLSKSLGIGVKETIAIILISQGMNIINNGDYISGGALVAVGWILLVIDRYLL